jgi:hypothetical protein
MTASNLSAVPNTQMDAVYKRIRKHFSYFDPNKKFPIFHGECWGKPVPQYGDRFDG